MKPPIRNLIFGPIDEGDYNLDGKLDYEARIKLPDSTKRKVLLLDKLFVESLDWDNPGGDSMWDKSQWEYFYSLARELHREISDFLGDDFEIIYKLTETLP